MTVALMRAALTALQPTAPLETAFTGPGLTAASVVKREKPRVGRNGIKRPVKGKCADVLKVFHELRVKGTESKDLTTAIHAVGEKRGWNRNNVGCELSAYRRFHGIGRPRKG